MATRERQHSHRLVGLFAAELHAHALDQRGGISATGERRGQCTEHKLLNSTEADTRTGCVPQLAHRPWAPRACLQHTTTPSEHSKAEQRAGTSAHAPMPASSSAATDRSAASCSNTELASSDRGSPAAADEDASEPTAPAAAAEKPEEPAAAARETNAQMAATEDPAETGVAVAEAAALPEPPAAPAALADTSSSGGTAANQRISARN